MAFSPETLARQASSVHWRDVRRAILIAMSLIALAGCRTTSSKGWTGGGSTPFKQAESSCTDLTKSIGEEADRREFFIGCMGSLGWAAGPGVKIDL